MRILLFYVLKFTLIYYKIKLVRKNIFFEEDI